MVSKGCTPKPHLSSRCLRLPPLIKPHFLAVCACPHLSSPTYRPLVLAPTYQAPLTRGCCLRLLCPPNCSLMTDSPTQALLQRSALSVPPTRAALLRPAERDIRPVASPQGRLPGVPHCRRHGRGQHLHLQGGPRPILHAVCAAWSAQQEAPSPPSGYTVLLLAGVPCSGGLKARQRALTAPPKVPCANAAHCT